MKIIEARDSFIKIETKKRISISSFILIKDNEKQYVAQIIQLKHGGNTLIAYAKILYLYNNGIVAYDKTLPSLDASVESFSWNLINGMVTGNTNSVSIGRMIEEKTDILADSSIFDKKTLISINSNNIKNILISNLIKQLSATSNIVVIDMQGNVDGKHFLPGVDFKLPLNYDSLAFMYEDCLNDATSDSKSLIGSIFKDLAEYSKSVDFLPFETLKSIVDDMVNNSHVFKLLVLKNKLAKFSKAGYFANNKQEAENLENILNSNVSVIDLSKLDLTFQNRYINIIYSILEKMDINIKIFVNVSNYVNKQSLKKMVLGEKSTTIIANSHFRYLKDLKSMYPNYIIEPDFSNNEIFNLYQTFLNSMQKESVLIVGENTNYIPLVAAEEVLPLKTLSDINDQKADITDANAIVIEKQTSGCIEKLATEIEEKPEKERMSLFIEEEPQDNIETEAASETSQKEPEDTNFEQNLSMSADENIQEEAENGNISEEVPELKDNNDDGIENINETELETFDDNIETVEFNQEIADSNNSVEENENETEAESENVQILENFDDFHTQLYSSEPVSSDDNISELTEKDANEVLVEQDNLNSNDSSVEEPQKEILAEEDSEAIVMSEDISELIETDSKEEVVVQDVNSNTIVEQNDEIVTEETLETVVVSDDVSELTENDLNEEIAGHDALNVDNNNVEEQNDDLILEEITEQNDSEQEINQPTDDENLLDENINQTESLEYLTSSPKEDSEMQELNDTDEILLDGELSDDDILIDITEPELDSVENTDLDNEINNDVDSLYTTIKDDTLSEDDLDLIDELNGESVPDETVQQEELSADSSLEELPYFEEENGDDELLEPIEELQPQQQEEKASEGDILETKTTSTPIVPVYSADIPAEDRVISDSIAQGDSVMHAKYGAGIVEKMIKYGTKTLYSINFDNVGRRLLDPTLTELKKV